MSIGIQSSSDFPALFGPLSAVNKHQNLLRLRYLLPWSVLVSLGMLPPCALLWPWSDLGPSPALLWFVKCQMFKSLAGSLSLSLTRVISTQGLANVATSRGSLKRFFCGIVSKGFTGSLAMWLMGSRIMISVVANFPPLRPCGVVL